MSNFNKKHPRKNSNYKKDSALEKDSQSLSFREKQENEAIERMKLLELHPNVIREFQEDKIINKSELIGFLYWLDDDEKDFVKSFEAKYDAVVYHIVKTNTSFGCMLSIFYVSKHESEWAMDRADIENGIQCCYVKNLDDDWCSEFGCIGFRKNIGGLVRTA